MRSITVDVDSRRRMGESNSQAKLSVEKVLEIRQQRRAGASILALAKRFGVSKSCIWSVVKGQTWRLDRVETVPALDVTEAEKVAALKKKGFGRAMVADALGVSKSSAASLLRDISAIRETCLHGHPLVEENIYVNPHGVRCCRECNRQAALSLYYRKAAAKKGKV